MDLHYPKGHDPSNAHARTFRWRTPTNSSGALEKKPKKNRDPQGTAINPSRKSLALDARSHWRKLSSPKMRSAGSPIGDGNSREHLEAWSGQESPKCVLR